MKKKNATHTHACTRTHNTTNTHPSTTRREKVVPSTNGLLSTVGFKLAGEACVYALEGSIAYAGSTVQWLRDNLEVCDKQDRNNTQKKNFVRNTSK